MADDPVRRGRTFGRLHRTHLNQARVFPDTENGTAVSGLRSLLRRLHRSLTELSKTRRRPTTSRSDSLRESSLSQHQHVPLRTALEQSVNRGCCAPSILEHCRGLAYLVTRCLRAVARGDRPVSREPPAWGAGLSTRRAARTPVPARAQHPAQGPGRVLAPHWEVVCCAMR